MMSKFDIKIVFIKWAVGMRGYKKEKSQRRIMITDFEGWFKSRLICLGCNNRTLQTGRFSKQMSSYNSGGWKSEVSVQHDCSLERALPGL